MSRRPGTKQTCTYNIILYLLYQEYVGTSLFLLRTHFIVPLSFIKVRVYTFQSNQQKLKHLHFTRAKLRQGVLKTAIVMLTTMNSAFKNHLTWQNYLNGIPLEQIWWYKNAFRHLDIEFWENSPKHSILLSHCLIIFARLDTKWSVIWPQFYATATNSSMGFIFRNFDGYGPSTPHHSIHLPVDSTSSLANKWCKSILSLSSIFRLHNII